jgi:hypothetical protein
MYVPMTHSPLRPVAGRSLVGHVVFGIRLVGLLLTIAGWLIVAGVSDGIRFALRRLRGAPAPIPKEEPAPERTKPALR